MMLLNHLLTCTTNFMQCRAEDWVVWVPGPSRGPLSSPPTENDAAAPAYEVNQAELDLLLGKVYSGWRGHVGDAYDVYDKLIQREPNDFRYTLTFLPGLRAVTIDSL